MAVAELHELGVELSNLNRLLRHFGVFFSSVSVLCEIKEWSGVRVCLGESENFSDGTAQNFLWYNSAAVKVIMQLGCSPVSSEGVVFPSR